MWQMQNIETGEKVGFPTPSGLACVSQFEYQLKTNGTIDLPPGQYIPVYTLEIDEDGNNG